jgi:hypothetical protein
MTGRLSGAYDPYPVLILRVWIGMNDKEKGDWADHPDNVPSLLPILEPIWENDVQRIVPNTLGDIKVHAVFGAVPSRFFSVPFKFHRSLVLTSMYVQKRILSRSTRPSLKSPI